MKIVKIIGGLGNQMFQYAFLLALRQRYNELILMDTSIFDTYKLHNGFELENVFHITAKKAKKNEISQLTFYSKSYFLSRVYKRLSFLRKTVYREKKFYRYYPQVFKIVGNQYYDGYWQNHMYFDSCRDLILQEFTYKNELDARNKSIEDFLLMNKNCVSIHIRRGDYLKHKLYKDLCGLDYYKKAIHQIKKNNSHILKWYIFSNDISWCKENILNFLGNEDVCFVNWNVGEDSYKDMRLMSASRINIIANSSFSWWAAYLNKHIDKEVYAPGKWVNLPMEFSIQMPDWILVD